MSSACCIFFVPHVFIAYGLFSSCFLSLMFYFFSQASPILDAFEVFGCSSSSSILLPPFPKPVFGPSMLWMEDLSKLLVCGGSSWRKVTYISSFFSSDWSALSLFSSDQLKVMAIRDHKTILNRSTQPATAGPQGKGSIEK